jgi:hypothetical protein
MSVRYEIEETTNAVKVFYDENTVPSLYQPHFPSGEVWNDAEEAEAWAKLYVASVEDELAPYAPNGRGQEGQRKPTKEEIDALRDQMNIDRKSRFESRIQDKS